MAVVIFSHEQGVYLGSCMGLGFWSNLDPVGQDAAVTFPDVSAAEGYMASWDCGRPDNVSFVEVVADADGFASIAACQAAGLPAWSAGHQQVHDAREAAVAHDAQCDCCQGTGLLTTFFVDDLSPCQNCNGSGRL